MCGRHLERSPRGLELGACDWTLAGCPVIIAGCVPPGHAVVGDTLGENNKSSKRPSVLAKLCFRTVLAEICGRHGSSAGMVSNERDERARDREKQSGAS